MFFDLIFPEEAKGYVHVALFKNGKPLPNGRQFVKLPEQRSKLLKLEAHAEKGDLYYSPALYSRQEATRAAALGTFVTWADVDREGAQCPSAGILVESGTPGHIHAYWRAGRLLPTPEAEAWNYYNAAQFNADQSGWDITQLLRVPGTLNHKTTPPLPVTLVRELSDVATVPTGIENLRVPKYDKPDILPKIETVLANHQLSDDVIHLLNLDMPPDRSDAMYRLACELSEQGLTADEAYVVIEQADEKWGKYTGRSDRDTRISQLVAKAFEATLVLVNDLDEPEGEVGAVAPEVPQKRPAFEPIGWRSLGLHTPPIEWVVDKVLPKGGFMLLTGDTGVGKSQSAIGLAARLVLGAKDWAGFTISSPVQQKILYLSLEMDQHGIKLITDNMSALLTMEQLELLEENLLFIATVASFKLDVEPLKIKGSAPVARQILEKIVKATPGLTGVVIDTLGAATSTSLQEESRIRSSVTWIKDTLRHKYGLWVLLIAHPRKEQAGQKRKEIAVDDVYGSRIVADEMDSAFALSEIKGAKDMLRLTNMKSRFSAKHNYVTLRRMPSLWLEKTTDINIEEPKGRAKADEFDIEDDSFEMEGNDWDE